MPGSIAARANLIGITSTRTGPLLKSESFVYNGNDRLIQRTDRKNQITTFGYDALDRRISALYADASTTNWTWDAGNRVTQIVDSLSGTITRSFDGLDRLSYEITPQGRVDYSYDAASRRTGLTVLGQSTIGYGYDNANRLTQVTQGTSTVTIGYDGVNRRTSLTLANGVVLNYAYDNANQLTEISYQLGASTLGDLTYSYDAAGRRTAMGGSFARTSSPSAMSSATYDAANRLSNWNGTAYSYDDNGNLLSDGTRSYSWDARDRLVGLSGGASGSFTYDALGRRTSKTVSGITTKFVYDGVNVVQEQNGSGAVMANLVPSGNIDELLSRTDAAGVRYPLPDALGSVLELTDATGVLKTHYTYEPYGETSATGEGNTSSYQYTGRENDNTGLYYYRARYYLPAAKRFVSEDPIGLAGGINRYQYVRGKPVSRTDPLGLFDISTTQLGPIDTSPSVIEPQVREAYEKWREAEFDRCLSKCFLDFVVPGVPDVAEIAASKSSRAPVRAAGKAIGVIGKPIGAADLAEGATACYEKRPPAWPYLPIY